MTFETWGPAVAPDLHRVNVDHEIRTRQNLSCFWLLAAEQGPDPGQQLLVGERLRQIVIRTAVEPLDALTDRRLGSQHQNRHIVSRGAKSAAHLDAIHAREHEIEDNRIRRTISGRHKGINTVVYLFDVVTLVGKSAANRRGNTFVVIHHQNSRAHGHRSIIGALMSG